MLRSILSSAIAPPTFLRESPLTNIVNSSAAEGRRGLIDANSSPEGPLQSKGRAAWRRANSVHSIHGSVRVGPAGRDLPSPTGRQGSNNRANDFSMVSLIRWRLVPDAMGSSHQVGVCCIRSALGVGLQFAQRRRIPPDRFLPLPFLGLNQDHLVALVLFQCCEQPIVESADFHHRQERCSVPEKISLQPLKELLEPVMHFQRPFF